jgi:hypothetical protein
MFRYPTLCAGAFDMLRCTSVFGKLYLDLDMEIPCFDWQDGRHLSWVREIFLIHVGGTRCVTSSTDHIMKIRARITLTVECIRTCIFYVYCMCKYKDEYDQD